MDAETLDFQEIHDTFRPKIKAYLTRLVGEFDAEDLTQEVFVRVSNNLHLFRGESQLSTWIYRIAANAAFDRMRQPSYQRVVQDNTPNGDETEGVDDELENPIFWTGEIAPSLEQEIHRKERLDCFCEYISQLPERYRMVLWLNEVEEFTSKEIAVLLGVSLEVVKMRLHRGRERLLNELKDHCKAEDWL